VKNGNGDYYMLPCTPQLLIRPAGTVVAAGGGGYSGPGDVVSSAVAWWGLRGYNAAYATGSNPAVDLQDQAGANPITINILSNGKLDVASINTWVTAHSVTTIKVAKVYDQTGNAHHLTQVTLALMPALTLNALGTNPALTGNNSVNMIGGALTIQAQPFTFSSVAKNTSSGTQGALFSDVSGNFEGVFNFSGSANTVAIFAGAGPNSFTASDASTHAMQFVFNGASSDMNVDGTQNTNSAGTGSVAASDQIRLFQGVAGGLFTGFEYELGYWASAFSTTQSSNVSSNQHAYWGF
jgi:hypothetical protein